MPKPLTPKKSPPRARKIPASQLARIANIVVVMLENRSFDHMLGYLYSAAGNVSPAGQPFEGLTGNESNPDAKGLPVKVFPIQAAAAHPYFQPGANCGEGYLNTNSQLFGTAQAPLPIVPATNQGFIANFAYTLSWESKEKNQVLAGTTASQIMGMYTPALLPVLSGLAKGYAVCDHWFASAPTETLPNRAFVHMATSQGHLSDSAAKVFSRAQYLHRPDEKERLLEYLWLRRPAAFARIGSGYRHRPRRAFRPVRRFSKSRGSGHARELRVPRTEVGIGRQQSASRLQRCRGRTVPARRLLHAAQFKALAGNPAHRYL